MTTCKPGDRVLVEATILDGPDSDGDYRIRVGTDSVGAGMHVYMQPHKVHPAPPGWAQPWPDGVWLTTIAEVRDRGLWWRELEALTDISDAPDAVAIWTVTPPSVIWSSHKKVLAREPIPQRRSVIIDLPEDATDAEIVAAWRTGGAE